MEYTPGLQNTDATPTSSQNERSPFTEDSHFQKIQNKRRPQAASHSPCERPEKEEVMDLERYGEEVEEEDEEEEELMDLL